MPEKGGTGGSGGGTGGGSGGVGGSGGSGGAGGGAGITRSLVDSMENFVIGEDFAEYLDRFNNYIELNRVADDIYKIRLLTNLMGPAASSKVSKACKPRTPTEYTYELLVKKCKTIFCGEKWSIAEHFKFNNRNQEDGESASDFSIELQALAENCSFGDFLDTALRDRFVAGLRDGAIKAKILNDAKNKPFDDIVKMAIASEMVDENIRVMDTTQGIHATRGRPENRQPRQSVWERMPRRRHHRERSRSRSHSRSNRRQPRVCYNCRQPGHFAYECKKDKYHTDHKKKIERKPNAYKYKSRVNHCDESSGESSDADILDIGSLRMSDSDSSINSIVLEHSNKINSLSFRRFTNLSEMVSVAVESQELEMEVDTGSCVSLISQQDFSRKFGKLTIKPIKLPLTVITGT
jgi:Zinc knuckle